MWDDGALFQGFFESRWVYWGEKQPLTKQNLNIRSWWQQKRLMPSNYSIKANKAHQCSRGRNWQSQQTEHPCTSKITSLKALKMSTSDHHLWLCIRTQEKKIVPFMEMSSIIWLKKQTKKTTVYVHTVPPSFVSVRVEDCGGSGGIISVVMMDIIWTTDSMIAPLGRLKIDTLPHPACTPPSHILLCGLGAIACDFRYALNHFYIPLRGEKGLIHRGGVISFAVIS